MEVIRTKKILLVLGLLVLCLCSVAIAGSVQWIYSYDKALRQAKQKNLPIMVDFYTDRCGWCNKLDRETYRDARIIELSGSFVCLKLDGNKERSLVNKYRVRGYPTILFTDARGKVLGGGAGYRNADKLLSEMRSVFSKAGKPKPKKPAIGKGKTIRSTTSSIGAFARNWRWSKQQQQDGEYAETLIDIKLPETIGEAALVLKHSYSQKAGKARARVYIRNTAQVAPKDKQHDKGKWWVGKAKRLGKLVGSFETQYSSNPPAKFNVTSFLRENPAKRYYVAVQNLSQADIGVSRIYLEVKTGTTSGSAGMDRPSMSRALQKHYNQIRNTIYNDYLKGRKYSNIRFYVAAGLHDLAEIEWSICKKYQEQQGVDCNSPVRRQLKGAALQIISKRRGLKGIERIYQHVRKSITYKEEKGNVPQFPYETFVYKSGDCEDQAILLAALLNLAGYESGIVRISDSKVNLHHVFCIVKVDPRKTPGPLWKFGEYSEYGYCWKILDPAYGHKFGENPGWLVHYKKPDGKLYIPAELAIAVILDRDEYKKLCKKADS